MAFPQVAATTSGNCSSNNSASLDLTLPSGISTGDRLQAIVTFDSAVGDTTAEITASGTGWTRLQNRWAVAVVSAVFEKREADGDDAIAISLSNNSVAEVGAYIVRRITGHDAASAAEVSLQDHRDVGSGDPSANIDAPSLSPSWGSADTLWIWCGAWDNASRTISSYPTNYGANQVADGGAGGSAGTGIASATRELAASSEDPGAAVISLAEQWIGWNIAVRPAGAGGGAVSTTLTLTDSGDEAVITGDVGPSGVSTTLTLTDAGDIASISGSAGPATGDIRLSLGIYSERGGQYASATGLRWVAFSDDTLGAIVASGSGLTTDTDGVAVIDIDGSPFSIGDYVPLLVTLFDGATSAPDRTVRTMFGFVPAIAQP